ncbi:MAG: nicotinate phosphoribosyltransferase [Deltaproteobacteria bacterium]|nr:nicotinate phosphoribosyltransferase [Deltaproteobacteria bacterium]
MRTDALKADLYQLKMAAGYFHHGLHTKRVSFELFVRELPAQRRFLLAAGLEHILEYLLNLRFGEAELDYLAHVPELRSAMTFEFREFLRAFRFRGDVIALPEGSVFFANEPIVRITGTLLEAQLVETYLLSRINSESSVASKAARIVHAAGSTEVVELGARRASPEEAVAAARASYIAGFSGTSNMEAGYRYDIPLRGTAAHSWIMSHDTELEAFTNYVATFPRHAILLVDTYETLQGTRRAIQAAGAKLGGVRLDSGDLRTLAPLVRRELDAAGAKDAIIFASGDLNEYRISELRASGAPIDAWGVGTEVVRPRDTSTLGAVYKIVYDHGEDRPVAKFSQGKTTLPGLHQVYRTFRDAAAAHDTIGLPSEFHVDSIPQLVEWMKDGRLVREIPSLSTVRAHARAQLSALPVAVLDHTEDSPASAYEVRWSHGLKTLLEDVRSRTLHP